MLTSSRDYVHTNRDFEEFIVGKEENVYKQEMLWLETDLT